MSLNGVWVLEISGVNGWERVSTVFFENGRYLGGNTNFYSLGKYTADGKDIKFSLKTTRHGKAQTVFGEKSKQFSTEIKAEKSKNKIQGYAKPEGAHSSVAKYPVRFLRQTDLPKASKKSKKS